LARCVAVAWHAGAKAARKKRARLWNAVKGDACVGHLSYLVKKCKGDGRNRKRASRCSAIRQRSIMALYASWVRVVLGLGVGECD
jgi:hypothetical protein